MHTEDEAQPPLKRCDLCEGRGMEEFPDSRIVTLPYSEYRYLPCAACGGTGFVRSKP